MSTVQAANFRHPSSPTTNLVLKSDGNVSGAGLDLIVKQSFSAVSSVSVNNCFTSTYDAYKVLVDISAITTSSQDVNMRLRGSGTDVSTTTYNYQRLYGNSTTAAAARTSASTFFQGVAVITGERTFVEWDIIYPAIATPTKYIVRAISGNAATTLDNLGGANTNATAYDGFTIYPASNAITGTLRVYGYRN